MKRVAAEGTPSIVRLLGEVLALPHRLRLDPVRAAVVRGDGAGRPVVVLPGFMVHDVVSLRLRRTLRAAGYDARGWGMGFNRGLRPETMDALCALVETIHAETGMKVALVGWSLGGLFAREVAKRRPHLVERVVTLASPFSGDPRANNVWRLYERVAGHSVDAPPIAFDRHAKPPVPTFAIWSRFDGVVGPACARGMEGERDAAFEVPCRHLDIISNPCALVTLADVLALPV